MMFGIWGLRHQIHIFFPGLYSPQRSQRLTEEEQHAFYDKGLRPCLERLTEKTVGEWPATLSSERFRATKKSGAVSYSAKLVPPHINTLLGEGIRFKLVENGVEWGQDLFFLHTAKGTKHSQQHSWARDAAEAAFETFLSDCFLSQAALDDGEWYIDVGAEFSSPNGLCFQWLTTSHYHMAKEVLRIPQADALRITQLGSSKYSRDISSHLPAVSGCRVETGRARGPYGAVYLQLYTTDKAQTYNKERGHYGKVITMKEAMGETQPPAYATDLFQLYASNVNSNSSHARVEVRVPIQFATNVLLAFEPRVIRQSLVAFTRSTWW
jgi:hypothetical protein